ncbi:MAG: hypothetical protein PHU25_11085, partial [Deltaproteobacteria bacterium]|nr:hypothetical protein [Deltaproteobacteria bacterium]
MAACLCACSGYKGSTREIPAEAAPLLNVAFDSYEGSGVDAERIRTLLANARGSDDLANTFSGSLSPENHAKLTHDPRLDAIAFMTASAFGENDTSPARSLVEWMLAKLGIAGSIYWMPSSWAKHGNPRDRLRILMRELARRFDGRGNAYDFGAAWAQIGSDKWAASLVIIEKLVKFHDLPKRYVPGENLVLRGRVLVPQRGVFLYMHDAGPGGLATWVDKDDDGLFLIKVPLPKTPGRYFVRLEVQREPGWWDVAFNMPIYVGMDEPHRPDPMILAPPQDSDPATQRKTLLEHYNFLRRGFGMSALAWDEPLAEIATDTADRAVAPCCRTPFWPSREMRDRGIRPASYLRNSAQFEFFSEIAWGTLIDPATYRLVLDDRFDRFGLGLGERRVESYRRRVASQYFAASRPARLELPADAARALDVKMPAYDDLSARENAVPSDPRLLDLGRRYAEALAERMGAVVQHDPALDVLARLHAVLGDVNGEMEQEVLWKLGVVGRVTRVTRRVVRADEVAPFTVVELAESRECCRPRPKGGRAPKGEYLLGIGRKPLANGFEAESIVLIERSVVLDEPLAKRHEPLTEITLAGRLFNGARQVHAYEDHGGKAITIVNVPVSEDGRFVVKLLAAPEPGRYFVQLTTEEMDVDKRSMDIDRYERSVMLLPIWVASDEPSEIEQSALDPPPSPTDERTWPERVRAIYNEARAAAGLPPFGAHRWAGLMLRDFDRRLRQSFDAANFGDLAARLKENGGGILTALGGIPADQHLETAVRWSLNSPMWRSNVLDDR